ncbi:MAG: radical SAM protein [Lysobacter sp.]|nr:radical SAM protein [Lysobacter sp.]
MARYLLVSPRIAVQKSDFLGSGVPYWPMELAVFAAFLRDRGDEVTVFDLFGASPGTLEDRGDHYLQGQALGERLGETAFTAADAVVVYALSYMSHRELLALCSEIRARRPEVPLAVLENSQAVTAYGLDSVAGELLASGADLLICGEAYWNWAELRDCLMRRGAMPVPENAISASRVAGMHRRIEKEPSYPVPAWDLFPIANYWRLPYSHGPKTARYLPVLTSRGCPYPCDFCVVPETNNQRWRPRTPKEVVDELVALRDRFDVHDFQIEDLNPTVRGDRWRAVCEELVRREAGIRFYFVSGTKAETVKVEDVPLLARAGCRYISISPESGSPRLMKVIGKRFDHAHGLELARACHREGIAMQACFLVGHPDETEADFEASRAYLRDLVRAGADEVAIFVVAPLAGSTLFKRKTIPIVEQGALVSFSPKGRLDWETVSLRRKTLIRIFFIEKLKRGGALWMQGLRALFGTPRTKMENLPRRVGYLLWRIALHRLRGAGG